MIPISILVSGCFVPEQETAPTKGNDLDVYQNHVIVSEQRIEVMIRKKKFNVGGHAVTSKTENGEEIALIDGQKTIGTDDTGFARTEIDSFEVRWNGKLVDIPTKMFSNCFNPHLRSVSLLPSEDGTEILITMRGSDGGGSYHVGYGRQMGDVQYVYICSMAAFFVLLLACINFMNLATARSANRAKEIGMRKVTGASRTDIAKQFLGESLAMAFSALGLSLALVALALPAFNALSRKEITIAELAAPETLLGLFVVALFAGLVSGSYPAFFLSAFKPVSVLKDSLNSGAKSSLLRKVLVVSQFTLSIFLVIGTAVVYNQLQFMKTKNLGYDREHLIYIPTRGEIRNSYGVLKKALLTYPEILAVTATSYLPTRIGSNSDGARWDGYDPEKEILINHTNIDYDYVETLRLDIVQGRSFSRDFPSDAGTDSTGGFLINQRLAEMMAVEPIIGANFSFLGQEGSVVGVMKDFHYHSVRREIQPLALRLKPPEQLGNITIRIQPENISASMEVIRREWNRLIPNHPFEFRFVDEDLDKTYRAEERMADVLKFFSVLALIISGLGLFGLASFLTEQRTKEVGVRKVLGASVANIVMLLSTEFTRWVVLANVIAWPAAYFALNAWLQKFAYRTELGWFVFATAAGVSIVVALLTVSSQAIKSAVRNPAEALRYE